MDHISYFGSCSNGIFGDICLYIAELEVVACVEHTAVSVASVVDKSVAAVVLGSRYEHSGTVKVLCKKGLGSLGTEVSEVYNDSVAACCVNFVESLSHILLVLDNSRTLEYVSSVILLGVSLDYSLLAVLRKAHGEAVAGYCNDTELHVRCVSEFLTHIYNLR